MSLKQAVGVKGIFLMSGNFALALQYLFTISMYSIRFSLLQTQREMFLLDASSRMDPVYIHTYIYIYIIYIFKSAYQVIVKSINE